MKNKLLYLPVITLSLSLSACFLEGDSWKKEFGTPELLLENARDECSVYLYEDQSQFQDTGNVIKDAIIKAAPFSAIDSNNMQIDTDYFTFEASWIPATSGPNYEHLSIWKNGFVRIHHKSSLGPHKYLYFSINEEIATPLVELVFSLAEAQE